MKDTSCGYPENRYNHIVQIWTAHERINGDIFMTEKGGNKMGVSQKGGKIANRTKRA